MLSLLKKEEKKEECQITIVYFVQCVRKLCYYSNVIHSFDGKSAVEHDAWWCLNCVIVYSTRDIPAFVMYCVYGASGSSLFNRVYQLYDMYLSYTSISFILSLLLYFVPVSGILFSSWESKKPSNFSSAP